MKACWKADKHNSAVVEKQNKNMDLDKFAKKEAKTLDVFPSTPYGKRLYDHCVRVALYMKPEGRDQEKFVNKFHRWVKKKKHQKDATKAAEKDIKKYIKERSGKIKKVYQYVQERIKAFEMIGIEITKKMKDKINIANNTLWSKEEQKDTAKKNALKHESIKNTTDKFKEMAKQTSQAHPSVFFQEIDKFKNGPSSTAVEKEQLNVFLNHSNKVKVSKDEMYAHQLKLSSYILYTTALGIRSGHVTGTHVKDMILPKDGDGLLQRYYNGKNSAKAGEKVTSYTRVAFGKSLEGDAIVSLSLYVFYLAYVLAETPTRPFMFGKDGSKRSHVEDTNKRLRALINISAVLTGDQCFAYKSKKLHMLRATSTNILTTKQCSSESINLHQGWKLGTKEEFYQLPDETALANIAAFTFVGRTGKEDPPHPAFDNINEVDEGLLPEQLKEHPTLVYLGKIAVIAIALDVVPPYMKEKVAAIYHQQSLQTLQKTLEAHCRVKLRFKDIDIKKRERELKEELIAVRTELELWKRRKVEEVVTPSKETLCAELDKLKEYCKKEGFPESCLAVFLDKLYGMIDVLSNNGSFGLKMKTAEGKALRKVLKLVAAKKKGLVLQRSKPTASWLEYANKELNNIIVSNWQQYKQDYC